MTVFQPPAGARDLLPLDVAQKQWIEHHLHTVFDRWGYHQIVTSTLERLDMLMAGGAIDPLSVIQVQDPDDGVLGLRPELTASIARAAVTRLTGASFPQRLYYCTNVFRREPGSRHGRQYEFHQAGVELIGAGGTMADAEILLLLADCLDELGIKDWQVVVGQASLTRSLLELLPETVRGAVRTAIANLDRIALEQMSLTPEQRQHAVMLFDLRGRPQTVLQQLRELSLTPLQQTCVANLEATIQTLAATNGDGGLLERTILDLSTLETFDYYTGIVFSVVLETGSGPCVLGKGGRYDDLLGLYHPQGESRPGIGFGLSIEELQQTLHGSSQLPKASRMSDWLVLPRSPEAHAAAHAYARTLRQTEPNQRIEVGLEEIAASAESARDYARRRGVKKVAWVEGEGKVTIETLS